MTDASRGHAFPLAPVTPISERRGTVGVLTRREFDVLNEVFDYANRMVMLLLHAEWEWDATEDFPIWCDEIVKARQFDRKFNYDFENGFFDFLPSWYLDGITPLHFKVKTTPSSNHYRFLASALELACDDCEEFRHQFDSITISDELESLLVATGIPTDGFFDSFMESVNTGRWGEEVHKMADGPLIERRRQYFESRPAQGRLTFHELSCVLQVEHSRFLTDNIEFSREFIYDRYPPGACDFFGAARRNLVTIEQIANHVYLDRRSMGPYTKDWPDPVIAHGGRRPAKYDYDTLLPTLQSQFPKVEWPRDPADLRKKSDS